jgi:hypothetical protein
MNYNWLYIIPLVILTIVLNVYFFAPGWHTTTYIASGLSVAAVASVVVAVVNHRHKSATKIHPDIIVPKPVDAPKPPSPSAKVVPVDTDDF